jgi:Lantibiotic dehydratase, N terminus
MTTREPRVALPEHLVRVNSDWAAWRTVCVRGAGFPIERLTDLASPPCARAADRLVTAATADGRAAAERDFAAAFEAAVPLFTETLRQRAADPAFQEAVIWQNRHAWSTGVSVLLSSSRGPDQRSSKHRAKEALVTSYLQRYCAKNDSIGFFGPVGWARIEDGGPPIECRPGSRLLASRTVYFEGWAMDSLAAALGVDPALRPWLCPRLLPRLHVEGTTLHTGDLAPETLPAGDAALLGACTGERTAFELAHDLLRAGSTGLATAAEVYDALARLEKMGLIAWALEVPVESLFPERALRAQLERIGDEPLRARCVEALTALEEHRRSIVLAGGVERFEPAVAALEETFEYLTGESSTRRHGQAYAGRTLVYEDCRRDAEVTLGPGLLADLEAPLDLLLRSARWFTARAADVYREACLRVYDDLAAETGVCLLPFPMWWSRARREVLDTSSPALTAVKRDLQERWAAIIGDTETARRRSCAAAELAPLAQRSFDAPAPGWRAACYQSVDLLIAAPDVQAIQRGDCRYVLGELHVGANTLRTACLAGQHPDLQELLDATSADLPEPLVLPIGSRRGVTPRTSNLFARPRDLRLIATRDTCGIPPDRSLPSGSLVVERSGASLVVHTRDGRRHFDILEVLGDLVMMWTLQHFRVVRPARHTSRLSFDSLVVARESWTFPSGELSFASVTSEPRRFVEVRRWALANDLPRFVFVHVPGERKPFFVDLESLPSIDVLCRTIRGHEADGGGAVTVTEMLPEPHDTWLPDAGDRRYTCELRIVLVDQAGR